MPTPASIPWQAWTEKSSTLILHDPTEAPSTALDWWALVGRPVRGVEVEGGAAARAPQGSAEALGVRDVIVATARAQQATADAHRAWLEQQHEGLRVIAEVQRRLMGAERLID